MHPSLTPSQVAMWQAYWDAGRPVDLQNEIWDHYERNFLYIARRAVEKARGMPMYEDMYQDTLMWMFKLIPTYNGESNVLTYMINMANQRRIDRWRLRATKDVPGRHIIERRKRIIRMKEQHIDIHEHFTDREIKATNYPCYENPQNYYAGSQHPFVDPKSTAPKPLEIDIEELRGKLTDQQRIVLDKYILGTHSQVEIGEELGLSGSRISLLYKEVQEVLKPIIQRLYGIDQ